MAPDKRVRFPPVTPNLGGERVQTNMRGVGIEHYGGFYPPYDYDGGGGYDYSKLQKEILAHEPKAWLALATTSTDQKTVVPYLKKAGWKTIGSTRSSHGLPAKVWLHIYRNKDVKPPDGSKVGDYQIGGCSQQMYVRNGPVYDPDDFAYQMKVQVITRDLTSTEGRKMRTSGWKRIAKAGSISVWTNAEKDE